MTADASVIVTLRTWLADPSQATRAAVEELLPRCGYRLYPAQDYRGVLLFYPPTAKAGKWPRFMLMANDPFVPVGRITHIATELLRCLEASQ